MYSDPNPQNLMTADLNEIDFKSSFKIQEKKTFSNLYLDVRDQLLF